MKDLRSLLTAMRQRDYRIYTQPFQLNIVGVRADSVLSNAFDDAIHVFYRDPHRRWHLHTWRATTDPGTYWLRRPGHPQGTAILSQGQYTDAYGLDFHRGNPDHPALCQIHREVRVLRDYDRDAVLDFRNGRPDKGMFGINIHRALGQGTTTTIDRHSAGCQVFADSGDFRRFLDLCARHRDLYGNRFTYTLIDQRAKRRAALRRRVYRTGAGLVLSGLLWALTRSQTHKPIHEPR